MSSFYKRPTYSKNETNSIINAASSISIISDGTTVTSVSSTGMFLTISIQNSSFAMPLYYFTP